MPTNKKQKQLIPVTIKRKRWIRGEKAHSCLLNDKGRMCCLGFIARKVGFTSKEILDISCPSGIYRAIAGGSIESRFNKRGVLKKLSGLVRLSRGIERKISSIYGMVDTDLCEKMMMVNDKGIKPKEREEELTKLAAKAGYKFKFV